MRRPATREHASGIDQVLMVPTRPALGFGLLLPEQPWWSPTAFGFPGHGGSLGYADPVQRHRLRLRDERTPRHDGPDPRTTSLIEAVRTVVSRQPD